MTEGEARPGGETDDGTTPHGTPVAADGTPVAQDAERNREPAEPDPAGSRRVDPRAQERDREPVLPNRAWEDDDRAWGDRGAGDDDERYLRDVPPHWS